MIMHAARACGARMKTELLYDRYDTKQMEVEELKVLIWRYLPQLLE